MRIEDFYNNVNKSNYYLGMISQVYRNNVVLQVENLSLLSYRTISQDTLVPNTINYYVLIDSSDGIYFGEVFQAKVPSTNSVHEMLNNGMKENIFPEISIDILGVIPMGEEKFVLSGDNTVGITDDVYIANTEAMKRYLYSIEISSKKSVSKLAFTDVIMNGIEYPIDFNPNTLFDRHLMVIGTTNSGKSTSALSILESLIKNGIKTLIIDPVGEYSSSFSDSEVKKIVLGENTFIPVSQITIPQWALLFETNNNTQPGVLANAINSLRYQKKVRVSGGLVKLGQLETEIAQRLLTLKVEDTDFDLEYLVNQVILESVKVSKSGRYENEPFLYNQNQFLVQKINYKFQNTSLLNFFNSANNNDNLLSAVKSFATSQNGSLYIDASKIGVTDGIGGTIIDLITNYLLDIPKKDIQPFTIFIDEVHRYTQKEDLDSNSFYSGLTNIAREGRKKGLFLFLTTQNPNDVDKVLLGQIGTLLIHRLTSADELKSIQNHLTGQRADVIKKLNTGEAILTSINLLMDLHLKIRRSSREHDNTTPSLG